MEKLGIVFWKEYLQRVKKPSFILFTLLTPILFVAVLVVPMVMGMVMNDTTDKTVVVIDQTGKYLPILKDSKSSDNFTFVAGNSNLSAYRSDVDGPYYAFVTISESLAENPRALTIYSHQSIPVSLEEHITNTLKGTIRDERLSKYNLPNINQILEDSNVSLDISSVQWSSDGTEKSSSGIFATVVGQVFNVLLMMFVSIYGSMVMNSVIEEKKSRIVEIISSSVRPETLLFAKILAIGLLGITQLTIWALLIIIGLMISQMIILNSVTFDLNELQNNITATGMMDSGDIHNLLAPMMDFDFGTIIISFIFFFICSYITLASVYAAAGAATDSPEDANQLIIPLSMIEIFAFYGAFYSFNNPNGPLAFWGSFIPVFGPLFMLVRIPFDPPIWQLLLSYVVNAFFTVLAVWIAAKVFRVGLLMYGKKPSLKEILKWVRYN